jgi:hypothetical protein
MNWRIKCIEVNKMDFEQKPVKKGVVVPKSCYYLYICIKNFKNLGDSNLIDEEMPQDDDIIS